MPPSWGCGRHHFPYQADPDCWQAQACHHVGPVAWRYNQEHTVVQKAAAESCVNLHAFYWESYTIDLYPLYDVLGIKVLETIMFLCFHVRKQHQNTFSCVSSFNAYFYPPMDKGLFVSLYHMQPVLEIDH